MNLVLQVIWRAVVFLLIGWAATGMVVFVVLVRYTFARSHRRSFFITTECPACDGAAHVDNDTCSLCEGESALTTEVQG